MDLTERIGTPMFNGERCIIEAHRYGNGRLALLARMAETGEPMATLTVNLEREKLDPDELALNHDCAHDAAALLITTGIAGRPHRVIPPRSRSFTEFYVARLTPAFADLASEEPSC